MTARDARALEGAGPVALPPPTPNPIPQQQPLRRFLNCNFKVTHSYLHTACSDLGAKHYSLLPTLSRCNLHLIKCTNFKYIVGRFLTNICLWYQHHNQNRERFVALGASPRPFAVRPHPSSNSCPSLCLSFLELYADDTLEYVLFYVKLL